MKLRRWIHWNRGFLAGFLILLSSVVFGGDAPAPDEGTLQLARILRPDRTDQAVISPDGRFLAFTLNEPDGQAAVRIVDLDQPDKPGWTSPLLLPGPRAGHRLEVAAMSHTGFNIRKRFHGLGGSYAEPPAVTHLRWTKSDQLIVVTRSGVYVTNVESGDWRELFSARDLSAHAEAVAFVPTIANDNSIVVSSHPRDTEFVSGLIRTKQMRISTSDGKKTSSRLSDLHADVLFDRNGIPRVAVSPAYYSRPTNIPTTIMAPNSVLAPNDWDAVYAPGTGGPTQRLVADVPFQFLRPAAMGGTLSPASYQKLDQATSPSDAFAFRIDWEDFYGRRSFPLAFGRDPNVLFFASNKFSDAYGIYGLDLTTGRRTDFKVEVPGRDLVGPADALIEDVLVFDHGFNLAGVRGAGRNGGTHWVDPEIERIQVRLEQQFPGTTVELFSWDDARKRVLARISSDTTPGSFVVVETAGGKILTAAPCAPWIPPEGLNVTERIRFESAPGVMLEGVITDTMAARTEKKPLIVYLHDIPNQKTRFGFNRDAQALASLGFVVLEFDYRGSAGRGVAFQDSVKADFLKVPMQDLNAALQTMFRRPDIDSEKVALMGEGFGGYLALRALEETPARFKSVVAFNAPTDPNLWWASQENRSPSAFSITGKQRQFFRTGVTLPVLWNAPDGRPKKPVLVFEAGREAASTWRIGTRAWTKMSLRERVAAFTSGGTHHLHAGCMEGPADVGLARLAGGLLGSRRFPEHRHVRLRGGRRRAEEGRVAPPEALA